MFEEATPGFKLAYKDFNSLYPATTAETWYPIGHPQLTVQNKAVDWKEKWDNIHRGILKVKVLPPRGKRIPVLPYRLPSGRLCFPLCRTCALKHRKGLKSATFDCTHNDEERSWVGTYTHIEVFNILQFNSLKNIFYSLTSSLF